MRACLGAFANEGVLVSPGGAGFTVCSTVGPGYGVVHNRSPMTLLGTVQGRRRVTNVRTTVRQSNITLIGFLG